jgi:hypothetical protein
MTYDRVKKSSWTPPAKAKSSFFPQTHIQTKKETKPSWEVTGVHTSKEAMERIRRTMFGNVEPMVEAPKETAPQETQQVQNPTQVSEEAVSGEIQAKQETELSQSLGYGMPSQLAREGIRRQMFGNLEQTPVPKLEEGTSPLTIPQNHPLKGGEGVREGSQVEAGGEEKGLAETEISLPIQAKLTIGEPNDVYEQEADRVARQVVDKIHSPTPETVQREEMEDEEEFHTDAKLNELDHVVQLQPPEQATSSTQQAETQQVTQSEAAEEINQALHKPEATFVDTYGEKHRLFIQGEGAAARVMMASDIQDLYSILSGRRQTERVSEQQQILDESLKITVEILKLIKLSDAVITGKAIESDKQFLSDIYNSEFPSLSKNRTKLKHKLSVDARFSIPPQHPLAENQDDVELIGFFNQIMSESRANRTTRLQIDGITRQLNGKLETYYGNLAKLLAQLNPPLQEPRNPLSPSALKPPQPLSSEAERDAHIKRYLLPRPTYDFKSTAGASITGTSPTHTIKALEAVAWNVSTNRPEGSEPESGTERTVAGYALLQEFGLTGLGPNWVKMHLISQKLGGRGIPENLVPGPHIKNQEMERNIEKTLKKLVDQDERKTSVFNMLAKVEYFGSGTIPMSQDAQNYAKSKGLPVDTSDFAKKISFDVAPSKWDTKTNKWQVDKTKNIQAPELNLELPILKVPSGLKGVQGSGETVTEIKTLTEELDGLILKLKTTATPQERLDYVNKAHLLLSYPTTKKRSVDRSKYQKEFDYTFRQLSTDINQLRTDAQELDNGWKFYEVDQNRTPPRGMTQPKKPKEEIQNLRALADKLEKEVPEIENKLGRDKKKIGDLVEPKFEIKMPMVPSVLPPTDQEKKLTKDLEAKTKELVEQKQTKKEKKRTLSEDDSAENNLDNIPNPKKKATPKTMESLNSPETTGNQDLNERLKIALQKVGQESFNYFIQTLPPDNSMQMTLDLTAYATEIGKQSIKYDTLLKPFAAELKNLKGLNNNQKKSIITAMAHSLYEIDKKIPIDRIEYLFIKAELAKTYDEVKTIWQAPQLNISTSNPQIIDSMSE